MCLQSYKLGRDISNRVIAHLADGGVQLYVVTVVDKEVGGNSTTVPARKCVCSKCLWHLQALGSCSQKHWANDL